ncbi:oligosaccharide flippase family protein [Bifidobacterium thermacidophilum]|uniref:lipopolysaccharide biosynthesis protein n=1 Tax=Bifidobacterium thermacidophilum TaxID=246618 RepID=UPI0026F083F7|nr:oligosaccharide flippase family protein [Bifidobacterium thermacidophilum]
MGDKKQLLVNMVASLVNFAVSVGIGLVLTPYIVRNIGAEAYGFVGLANTFVSYAQLLTIALNSVAGRFITVAYHEGDDSKANGYYSSTLAANGVMVAVLVVVAVPVVTFLDKLVNISPHLVGDVKALFVFIFLNFMLSTISTVYSVATFVKNKLYLSSIANLAFSLVRVVAMIVLFGILPPKVYYVGLAVCLATAVMTLMNRSYTRRLLPDISFDKKSVSWTSIREMLSAGVWNVVTKLQQIMMFGLQLLVANLMISPYLMGMLSIAQTVPNQISGLMGTVSSLFYPEQTKYYAQGKHKELVEDLKSGMKVSGFFTNIIFVVMLVAGYDFMSLWQHGQDTELLYQLLTLTMLGLLISGVATTLQNLPLIVNRLKKYSIGWLIYSAISMVVLVAFIEVLPKWGVFLVAAIPPLFEILANVTFVPIYASRCLGIGKFEFYPIYIRYFASTAVASTICWGIRHVFALVANGWVSLILTCCLYALVTMLLDVVLLLGRKERSMLVGMLRRKLHIG